MNLGLIGLVRPCSKKICKCCENAIKLSLRIPISKVDEKETVNKMNNLYYKYRLCSQTLNGGSVLHETPHVPYS